MKRLAEGVGLDRFRKLFGEMLSPQLDREYEFRSEWVQEHRWQVVPVESAARIPTPDVPRLAECLRRASQGRLVAVNTDMPIREADVYELEASAMGLTELNRELGPFRFMITADGGEWGISCNEWYNLFGAPPALLVDLLGRPIDQARSDFEAFATPLGEPLASVGTNCARIAQ